MNDEIYNSVVGYVFKPYMASLFPMWSEKATVKNKIFQSISQALKKCEKNKSDKFSTSLNGLIYTLLKICPCFDFFPCKCCFANSHI